jgi:hypothetical protein
VQFLLYFLAPGSGFRIYNPEKITCTMYYVLTILQIRIRDKVLFTPPIVDIVFSRSRIRYRYNFFEIILHPSEAQRVVGRYFNLYMLLQAGSNTV